jgi:hypothetical protein
MKSIMHWAIRIIGQYIVIIEGIEGGGEEESVLLYSYSLATVTSCIDPSVKILIVTKYPKVRPLLIFSISLCV